jgi:hypothetical protein
MVAKKEDGFNVGEFLASTVESLVMPIFDKSWVSLSDDERNLAIERFSTLHKFVGKMRQSFDDTLTTEQAKGNLTEIEHIRKPREKAETDKVSMADFLKKL